MRAVYLLAICFPLLAACASPLFDVGRSETVLPVSRAWVDGRIVEYVTTDISDLAMARMMGANHVPAAYFSPSWTVISDDRGRHFSGIVDAVSG